MGSTGVDRFQQDMRDIFDSAVSAVYPPRMIRNAVKVSADGGTLTVDGRDYYMKNNVFVVGFGKAVSGMARAVEDLVGEHIVRGVISIPYGTGKQFSSVGKEDMCVRGDSKIRVYEGAKNNLPDLDSHTAAMAIQTLASELTSNDILIVLISGGGSALSPLPIPPITLEDELQMTQIVSSAGGSIQDLNTLRQNIEMLKGGGLASLAKPAKVLSLILSDVIEDKLDIISSGPTAPLLTSPRQCLQILDRLIVKDRIPATVQEVLAEKASKKKSIQDASPPWQAQSYDSEWDHVQNVIIGSNSIATKAALETASDLGYVAVILSNSIQGEAKDVAVMLANLAKYISLAFLNCTVKQASSELSATEMDLVKLGLTKMDLKKVETVVSQAQNSRKPLCVICGGETTVLVKGNGKGGRNQEMALAFALKIDKLLNESANNSFSGMHIEFLSAGTDGQDGPTNAAGAIVNKDFHSLVSTDVNPEKFLENNDSYTLFTMLNEGKCLVKTGLTGTNVMDVQLLVVNPMN